MISRVWAIAFNTYREALRQKILYALVFFTVILILFSLFLGQLSLGADVKIVKDMGLACTMFFGAMMSIFMGIGLVFKEIERRTIYTILSKPVSRGEFIFGKFFGLAVTIGLEVLLMTILLFLMLSVYAEPLDFNIIKAVLLIYYELCILIAVTLVFSSYSSSFMSALFSLSFLVVGHLTDDFVSIFGGKVDLMLYEATGLEKVPAYFLKTGTFILEQMSLDHFSINSEIVHGVPVGMDWILSATVYAFAWLFILLSFAIWLFRRKDLQ
jgi:ABC-type transport system involved in multi-copper enzyme maturation permease subunit